MPSIACDALGSSPPVRTALSVTSFNIGNGLVRPNDLVDFLRTASVDVIGLQEVAPEQAAALELIAPLYPFQVVRGTGFSGRALLCRYPIQDEEWLELSPGRPDLHATIDVNGTSVHLSVAHPPPPRLGRRGVNFDATTTAQIERLAALAVSASPAILLGDFNSSPRHPMYAHLAAAGLRDSYRTAGAGRGATFPLRLGLTRWGDHGLTRIPLFPIVRFDYIWHTRELVALDAWVSGGMGSDHRPVSTRLGFSALSPG
jgi:endonuclease/exonuclease/phosphatase family metal-dependent hydrolase